jgi:1-acyl-sn-glycerol-3-phosphate acyltransferase
VSESTASRWKRRAVTIPVMLGSTALAIVFLPALLVGALIVDVVRFQLRFPTVRFLLFALQYGLNDSVEILLAPLYWVWAGFGRRLHTAQSQYRHERLQRWSIDLLARRAEKLLGLRLDVDAASLGSLEPGPVIVLCRHVSIVDASLPALLYQRVGFRTRGVIMAELLADPGFDLLYGRTGSVFIPRDDGPQAVGLIAGLGATADTNTATIIFPEGQLFRTERLNRNLKRLKTRDPGRAASLAGLRHVLPPRPGGLLALLDAIPNADVVVIAHEGLDLYPSFRDLVRNAPLDKPIEVCCWRIRRMDIPASSAERTAWLDEQWCRVDDWIHSRT